MDITFIKAAELEITDDVRETKHWALLAKHGYCNTSLLKYSPSSCSLRMRCDLSGHVPDQMVRERGQLHDMIVDVFFPSTAKNHTISTDVNSTVHIYIAAYVYYTFSSQAKAHFNDILGLLFTQYKVDLYFCVKTIQINTTKELKIKRML